MSLDGKVALVTGSARRIGAAIACALHAAGARVVIHYRQSSADAATLADRLNADRAGSAMLLEGDLLDTAGIPDLVERVVGWRGRLDVVVNNASTFYPTPIGKIDQRAWRELVGSNLEAPLFLSQAAAPHLADVGGSIVNIVDIHARRPLRDHSVYGAAKAGLEMLTRSLAKDLAPEVRVNAVAPGAILWPENGMTDDVKATILDQVPLQRPGTPADIASCVLFLVRDAAYVTGQVIAVDGGRSVGW